jgi:hypothetical protein
MSQPEQSIASATTTIVFFSESGDGERLSGVGSVDSARAVARRSRARLVRQITGSDDVLESEDLIFDYGADHVGPDDTGAQCCDECGAWTVELLSSMHDRSCSLNPRNVVRARLL